MNQAIGAECLRILLSQVQARCSRWEDMRSANYCGQVNTHGWQSPSKSYHFHNAKLLSGLVSLACQQHSAQRNPKSECSILLNTFKDIPGKAVLRRYSAFEGRWYHCYAACHSFGRSCFQLTAASIRIECRMFLLNHHLTGLLVLEVMAIALISSVAFQIFRGYTLWTVGYILKLDAARELVERHVERSCDAACDFYIVHKIEDDRCNACHG
eukprot:4466042-Amphidinium_carterae.3